MTACQPSQKLPIETPRWLTPVEDRLLCYDDVAGSLRKGQWHLHALHRADGTDSGLVAVRKPNGRVYYIDLDGDVLALQFIAALLPTSVFRRLAEIAYDHGRTKLSSELTLAVH